MQVHFRYKITILFSIIFTCFSQFSQAQVEETEVVQEPYPNYNSTNSMYENGGIYQTLRATIYSKNFDKSREMLMKLVDSSSAKIQTLNEGNNRYSYSKSLTMTIHTNKAGFEKIDKGLPEIGFVDNKNISTHSGNNSITDLELDLKYTYEKIKDYEDELKSITNKSDNQYRVYWEKIIQLKDQAHNIEKQISASRSNIQTYTVELTLAEETYTPQSSRNQRVHFVNMPGVEYMMLRVENPKEGLSADLYQGGAIKYLFTRGKSYVSFGAMRATNIAATDSTTFKELFVYNFGQDFYPRHFGRGQRKFLNLYTGYHVGGMFATSEVRSKHIFEATPHIGLELFKSKTILLDSKIGYTIPFYENRNLRGIQANASFNFLF